MQHKNQSGALTKRVQSGGEVKSDTVKRVKPAPPQLLARKSQASGSKSAKRLCPADSRREALLDEFADRYERLVSVLCDAAKNGCAPRLEVEYVDIRRWLLDRRSTLPSYRGAKVSLSRGETGATDDPIEQIVRPTTLADLLATDAGELIERVSKVSEAVFEHCATSRSNIRPTGR
jgi:hypothetical protein